MVEKRDAGGFHIVGLMSLGDEGETNVPFPDASNSCVYGGP